MMLNKETVWIFGTPTLQTMLTELNNYLDEVKNDPEPPKGIVLVYQLRDLIQSVIKDRILENAG